MNINDHGFCPKCGWPSKGQYQKLALARTLYKDSPIIILDEPTASIDSISSKKIFENLKQIPKDKTVILVSHNMIDIVDFADRILVFNDGKIVGDGTHDELIKSSNVYKELYESEIKQGLFDKIYTFDNI